MKKLLLLAAVVLAAAVAWNYLGSGSGGFTSSGAQSEEVKAIKGLEQRLATARAQFAQAGRGAALSGVDTTADAETARLAIEKVQSDLHEIEQRDLSAAARAKASQLEQAIAEAKQEIGAR